MVYPDWRGGFYPTGLTQKNELAYALEPGDIHRAQRLVRTPCRSRRVGRAGATTPDDFVFSVKAPRFITHIRRLDDVHEPLANFFASGILALGPKLGV